MKSISVQTRIQLRNVLYCTDLSPSASSALPQAVALARHFGSTLHALHVRLALEMENLLIQRANDVFEQREKKEQRQWLTSG
jgi:nucleotide-binding universal stress UspA family protein